MSSSDDDSCARSSEEDGEPVDTSSDDLSNEEEEEDASDDGSSGADSDDDASDAIGSGDSDGGSSSVDVSEADDVSYTEATSSEEAGSEASQSEEESDEAAGSDEGSEDQDEEEDEDECEDDEEEEDEGEEEEDDEDAAEDESDVSSLSTNERRRRRRHPLSAAQQAELSAMRRSRKLAKKHTFKLESSVDPPFFSYLSLMHEWHALDLASQRKTITSEKTLELEQSLYDPADGVEDGMKSVWDQIQQEIDVLPVARRLSSPLKFRRVGEICMEVEHTGRMRRMLMMERGILHTVLYMLRSVNGKIVHRPPPRCGAGTPIRDIMGDDIGTDDETMPISVTPHAAAAARTGTTRQSRVAGSRSGGSLTPMMHLSIPEDGEMEEHKGVDVGGGGGVIWPELPLRTRSSLRRSTQKASRPTTFTNIPPRGRRRTGVTAAMATITAPPTAQLERAASAPPVDIVVPVATPPRPTRGRKRRAPRSNETAATHTSTHTMPLRNNVAFAHSSPPPPPPPNTRAATLELPKPRLIFQRHSSHPPPSSASAYASSLGASSAHTSPTKADGRPLSSPLPVGALTVSPHRAWVSGLIRHRDDLHLFLAALLFMAFVHVTDSEKLSAFKRQMLTALLHHAGWGKQAIQKQMQRLLRVPTVATGTTSAATAFSQVSTPITPSNAMHALVRQKPAMHQLHPNANMIYQFDAICLDLIGRDLLPLLSEPVPGQQTDQLQAERDERNRQEEEHKHAEDAMEDGDTAEDEEEEEQEEDVQSDESDAAAHRARRAPPVKRPPRRSSRRRSRATHPVASARLLRSHGAASFVSLQSDASGSSKERSPALVLQPMSARPPVAAAKPSAATARTTRSQHALMMPAAVAVENDVRSPFTSAVDVAARSTPATGASPRWSQQIATWVSDASHSVMQTLGWKTSPKPPPHVAATNPPHRQGQSHLHTTDDDDTADNDDDNDARWTRSKRQKVDSAPVAMRITRLAAAAAGARLTTPSAAVAAHTASTAPRRSTRNCHRT